VLTEGLVGSEWHIALTKIWTERRGKNRKEKQKKSKRRDAEYAEFRGEERTMMSEVESIKDLELGVG
jgi:hypothetical protein